MTAKERWLRDFFNLDPEDVDWAAKWNGAPTPRSCHYSPEPEGDEAQVPPDAMWSRSLLGKDTSIAAKATNAMCETAAEKPAFREAIRKRRCLVPADGLYEWARIGQRSKQPYNIGLGR